MSDQHASWLVLGVRGVRWFSTLAAARRYLWLDSLGLLMGLDSRTFP